MQEWDELSEQVSKITPDKEKASRWVEDREP